MEPKPCQITKGGGVEDSALGKMMGMKMTSFQCSTHGEKWATSEKAPKSCPPISWREEVMRRIAGAKRDGTRYMYSRELVAQEKKIAAKEARS